MTPEERDLLQKTFALSQENNEMLKRIRGSQKMSNVMRIGYWVVIVVLTIASFWLFIPYLNGIQGAVSATDTGSPSSASGGFNLSQTVQSLKSAYGVQ